MQALFYKLPQNILACFRGRTILWQLVAFALTFILVVSGFDWGYYQATRGDLIQTLLWPAVILGFFLPVVLPLGLLIFGYLRKNKMLLNTAFATGQAALVGLGLSSLYKLFTGRVGPQGLHSLGTILMDITHNFRFGFDRGGAFQGWPSSHTTVAFAMSMALVALFPKGEYGHKWVKYIAIIYAFYIGIGVSVNIHWFSDFVAGAILGTIIGLAIGKSFHNRLQIKSTLATSKMPAQDI